MRFVSFVLKNFMFVRARVYFRNEILFVPNNKMSDNYTSIKEIEKTVHVSLPLSYVGNVLRGVMDVLEDWKCRYVQLVDGVVLDFKNISFLDPLGRILADHPFVHYDIKADFSVFKPSVGNILKGVINRISRQHVGCLVHESINVSIKLSEETPPTLNNYLVQGNEVIFCVTHVEIHRKSIRVKGKLTNECLDLMKESFPLNVSSNHTYFDNTEVTTSTLNDLLTTNSNIPKVPENTAMTSNIQEKTSNKRKTANFDCNSVEKSKPTKKKRTLENLEDCSESSSSDRTQFNINGPISNHVNQASTSNVSNQLLIPKPEILSDSDKPTNETTKLVIESTSKKSSKKDKKSKKNRSKSQKKTKKGSKESKKSKTKKRDNKKKKTKEDKTKKSKKKKPKKNEKSRSKKSEKNDKKLKDVKIELSENTNQLLSTVDIKQEITDE